jgi:hypothetical protein
LAEGCGNGTISADRAGIICGSGKRSSATGYIGYAVSAVRGNGKSGGAAIRHARGCRGNGTAGAGRSGNGVSVRAAACGHRAVAADRAGVISGPGKRPSAAGSARHVISCAGSYGKPGAAAGRYSRLGRRKSAA